MPQCHARKLFLLAALAWAIWGCLLSPVGAQNPTQQATQTNAAPAVAPPAKLKDFGPSSPVRAAAGPSVLLPPPPRNALAPAAPPGSEELPPPRRADPAAPSPPLEVIEFREVALQDAMRLLSQQTGLNIVPSKEAGQMKVSLYLENTTAEDAVRALAQAYGLITRPDPALGIIRITTTKENQASLDAFNEEETEVFTLLYPNAANVGRTIQTLYYGRARVDFSGQFLDQQLSTNLEDRLSRFDLINSRSLGLGFFQNGGFGNGGAIGGTGVGVTSVGGGGVGVTSVSGLGGLGGGVNVTSIGGPGSQLPGQANGQAGPGGPNRPTELTADEIQELEDALAQPGTERSAVLLNILRRRQTTIYVTVIESHNQLVVRSSDAKAMQEIRDLVSRMDVPTPVVLLEVKVLSINLGDDFTSVFNYQFTDGMLTSGGFVTGPTTSNILPPFADNPANLTGPMRFNALNPGPIGEAPPQGLNFQVVSSNFRARMQLLESKNRVTELATPFLMSANNEVNRIFSGVTQPITTGFSSPQIVTNTTTTTTLPSTPITTLQDLGTTLLITPNVNADRTVTLRILEENSSDVPNGANIPIVSASGATTEVPVDTVSRQTISGTVVALDGQTLAFGGLIQESLSDQRQEVPVLGKIPFVGTLFRSQVTMRTRTELVILIRPFVLTAPGEACEASHSMVEALSIHPNVPRGGLGDLGTYVPAEVLKPNPPRSELQKIFKTNIIIPRDY